LLSEIGGEFFNTFCRKMFSLFYDFNQVGLEWNVETSFQKIGKMSKNKESKFNEGWIHYDPYILSGIIYLSKNSVGTNIYDPINLDTGCTGQEQRDIFYSGNEITEEEYSRGIIENNSRFEETIRIGGKFNRLVLFEGGVYHGVPSFYCDTEDRLTQVFFVNKIDVVEDRGNYPIVRSKVG